MISIRTVREIRKIIGKGKDIAAIVKVILGNKELLRTIVAEIAHAMVESPRLVASQYPEAYPEYQKPVFTSNPGEGPKPGWKKPSRGGESLAPIAAMLNKIFGFETFVLPEGPHLGEIRVGEVRKYVSRYKRSAREHTKAAQVLIAIAQSDVFKKQKDDMLPLSYLPISDKKEIDDIVSNQLLAGALKNAA